MRTRTFATLTVTVVALSGCGSSDHFANKPRPPAPVNLTVYVNNARVSVSPDSVGAGQIIFIVNPQATAQVTVELHGPRDYTIAAGKSGTSEAAAASPSPIQPGRLHVGKPRPSASNALLQP
jgi:hypothetical protein